VPSIGCAKSVLVGATPSYRPTAWRAPRSSTGREVVGAAIRLRERTLPVFVSPGHLVDVDTAVDVVVSVGAGFREPETTRKAHKLVNAERVARRG
jgi:deoxyribonuclease V